MPAKKLTAFLLIAALAAALSAPCAAGGIPTAASALDVSAKAAVLIETSENAVVYEKNAHTRLPMASTTKIMTALVALENCDMSRIVSVSEKAVGVEGSSVYLYPNEKLCMNDLVYALMLESANDAATAIAIEIAGSTESFAELMNRKAAELGLGDTHFTNPHGLDDEQHYTSAYDLAMLTSYALRNDAFREIVSTYKRVIPLLENEGSRLLLNHNKLLKQYSGAIGVKTGFTKKSGRCLVSCAEREGLTFVAVTLSDPDDWSDHKKMLDLGFTLYERMQLAEPYGECYTVPCVGGQTESVRVSNPCGVSAVVERGGHELTKIVELKRFCYAPLSAGDTLGRVLYYDRGVQVGQAELTAESDVPAAEKKGFWDWLTSLFR